MIGRILSRLGQAPRPEAPADERLALAALLVRLARADGVYDPAEIARIDAVLAARFSLSAEAAAALRRRGEALEAEAADTVRFTRRIKEMVPLEERMAIIEALWEIALADSAMDDEEAGLMRLVASLLGISDRDSALARRRVRARRRPEG